MSDILDGIKASAGPDLLVGFDTADAAGVYRLDAERATQNSRLLASMDRRARLQLRLQQTVEGLSVAAVSYYVVGLVAYLVVSGRMSAYAAESSSANFKDLMASAEANLGLTLASTIIMGIGGVLAFLSMIFSSNR